MNILESLATLDEATLQDLQVEFYDLWKNELYQLVKADKSLFYLLSSKGKLVPFAFFILFNQENRFIVSSL
jgi:hypothetical protein